MNDAAKSLALLKTKAGSGVSYFVKKHKEFTALEKTLEGRISKLESGIGSLSRKDSSVTTFIDELKNYAKAIKKTAAQEQSTTFLFGKANVKTQKALEGKIKSELPQKSQGNASAALNDAIGTGSKDASKAGTGVKHASAGKKGVSSCTVFFVRSELEDGLITEIKIVGVGSHKTNKSYDIHWSATSKLKAGKEFDL
ncbi:MAG: hypothetical protein ACI87E_004194 [Mariniblastus sp.]|jgi:hypothetical protein